MLEIPLIIRIIVKIHSLKLCDLESQGCKVRDSNYFTHAQLDSIDYPKFGHNIISLSYTHIHT